HHTLGAVSHRGHGPAAEHEPHVLDLAPALTCRRAHVIAPLPTRLVGRAAERHPAHAIHLEPSLEELPRLGRLIQGDKLQIHGAESTGRPAAARRPRSAGERFGGPFERSSYNGRASALAGSGIARILGHMTQPASSSALAVETEDLVKDFGQTRALDGLDLAVPAGSVYGLLGPNGAGKTTSIRVLATLLRPDGGSARVLGHDVLREPD